MRRGWWKTMLSHIWGKRRFWQAPPPVEANAREKQARENLAHSVREAQARIEVLGDRVDIRLRRN